MKHLGDITKIHGDQIEPVDCITFGSPCQGLFMAGKRLGFDDNRSVLFLDAARIIKEMRTATNGMYPTFAVWENVPGAFSSNGGEDFRAVLEELARVEQPDTVIPRPPRGGGRWSKAGAIAGNGWSLAWRQLDAQYWGVPQRRKRIALVADFGGQRAGEILFEQTSVSGDPDEGIPTWKEIAGLTTNRSAGNDWMVGKRAFCISGNTVDRETNQNGTGVRENGSFTVNTVDRHAVAYSIIRPVVFDARGNGNGKIVPTITGDHENRITDYTAIVIHQNASGEVRMSEIAHTLSTNANASGRNTPIVAVHRQVTSYGIGNGWAHAYASKEKSGTLDTMHDAQAVEIEHQTFSEQSFSSYKKSDKCSTLKAKAGNIGNGSECLVAEKAIRWIVRRLTPVECERLQGYPDDYTNIGDWTDSKGKKHKYADSPRYKALGNSIALPQWFWLVQKMRPYLKEKPTLGSLFDGLGGFPLVWQRAYGEGTARWASEIESFCVAVTKRRFGEE